MIQSGRMMTRVVIVAVVTLCLVAVAGTGVMAQQGRPCAGDVERFCKGIEPGQGRMMECLSQHKEELSPACKMHIAEVGRQAKDVHQACQDDIMLFCQGVKPGGGRIAECLKAHAPQLSPGCKIQIYETKKRMK